MKEIEAKALEIDKNKIIQKLESLKAKKLFVRNILAEYYKNNNNSLKLRLRSFSEKGKIVKVELTCKIKIKSPIKNAKAREELNLVASSMKEARRFLQVLGFKKFFSIKKKRTRYFYNKCNIELEEIKGIPPFLEVEGSPKRIKLIMKTLGIKNYNSFDLFELLKHYKKI